LGFFAEILQKGLFPGVFENFLKIRLSEMNSKGLSQVGWMLNTPISESEKAQIFNASEFEIFHDLGLVG